MQITQRDIELLTTRNRSVAIRLELLNKREQIIETLEGECINSQLSLASTSDVRRTCALTLYVKDASYIVSENARIWLDKYVRLSYGIWDMIAKDYRWYVLGQFMFASSDYAFTATEKTVSAPLVDLMAMFTQERGSAIGANQTIVPVGSNIRNAMVSVVTDLVGWHRHSVVDWVEGGGLVPFDQEFNIGVYPHEIIARLRDLYPGYETFFATDGTFTCQRIPTALSDEVILKAEIMDQLITHGGIKPRMNFADMKNVTEIWGMELEPDRYSDEVESVGSTYNVTIEDITVMDSGVSYGFTVPTYSVWGQKIQINALGAYPIYVKRTNPDGTEIDDPVHEWELVAGIPYVFLYNDGKFFLQGELNVHVVVMEVNVMPSDAVKAEHMAKFDCRNIGYIVNPESPFAVDRADVGMVVQVMHGGDFEKIYSTELALDRAAYETWKTTRLVETTTIECLLVPWLEINHKIEFTSQITGKPEQYLVKSATFDLSRSTMTVECVRFWPYYPWLQ